MPVSSLLLVAIDSWLLQRYAARQATVLEEIAGQQDALVMIVGFGRYGQIVGRMLPAKDVAGSVLDQDAKMVEAARSFGYQVFYGNAARQELLRTVGAAAARLVVAGNDVGQCPVILAARARRFPKYLRLT